MILKPTLSIMHRRYSIKGFTLVEMMVVLAILAVLMMWAVPSIRDTFVEARLRSLVTDLQASIMNARSAATQRTEPVVISPLVGSDWTTGWRTSTASANPALSPPVVLQMREASEDPTNKKITIDTSLVPTGLFGGATPQINFSTTGFVQSATGGFSGGCVTFKSTSSNSQRARLSLVVSASGRPKICNPDAPVGARDYEPGCCNTTD